MKIPLIGGTGEAFNLDVSQERTINWYPSIEDNGKNQLILDPTPGFVIESTCTPTSGTGCRGGEEAGKFVIMGSSVHLPTGTKVFDLNTSSGRVSVASGGTLDNTATGYSDGSQALLTDGTSAYVIASDDSSLLHGWELDATTLESGTATTATTNKLVDSAATFITNGIKEGMTVYNSTDDAYAKVIKVESQTALTLSSDLFPAGTESYTIDTSYGLDMSSIKPKTCTYMDGYFIVDDQTDGTRGRFYISQLNDTNRWNALDFDEAGRHYDKINCVKAYKRELWLIGKNTTEVWYNSGDEDFPFKPIQSGFIEYGTDYPSTVLQVDDSLLWLATTETGASTVVESRGGLSIMPIASSRISIMLGRVNLTNAFAVSYSYGDNTFYVLTLPSANISLVYNLKTKMWSELATSSVEFDSGFIYPSGQGTYYSARLTSNTLDTLSFTVFSNRQAAVQRTRISPVIHAEDKNLIYDSVEIEVAGSPQIIPTLVIAGTPNIVVLNAIDLTSLGITTGSDYIYNPKTGTSNVITTVASSNSLYVTDTPDFIVGDYLEIRDGTTNESLLSYSLSIYYKDNNGDWSSVRTKTITKSTDRVIFRKLGRSRNRVFKFSTNTYYPITIKSAYANVRVATI